MTEDDPEVAAMRERAEKVLARRAKERAEKRDDAVEEPVKARSKKKKGRQWYHWVIDGALLAMILYLLKTRFLDKEKEPDAPTPAASASAKPVPSVLTRASAELVAEPLSSVAIETLPPSTPIEVIELSDAGFMKVRAPSGNTGWVHGSAITMQ